MTVYKLKQKLWPLSVPNWFKKYYEAYWEGGTSNLIAWKAYQKGKKDAKRAYEAGYERVTHSDFNLPF